MVVSLLLLVIYVAFISLGLPDSVLGAAWPVISSDFNVPLYYAGIISMISTASTIVSSLLSNKMTYKFGPGLVTAFSVSLTSIALFGMANSSAFWMLCICAIPFGLGAGAVDAALNNYVAINFKARHMSWLHCFWGIGASVSPYIMGHFLLGPFGWKGGYIAIGIVQLILSVIFFFALPLWKKNAIIKSNKKFFNESTDKKEPVSISNALRIKGVIFILIVFFAYCALETTAGFWASSYLVKFRFLAEDTAACFASLFYFGITIGRLISGFIAEKIGDKRLVRIGSSIIVTGILMIMIPFKSIIPSLTGLVIIGLGCAPIYPSIIHLTPVNFGKENSQAIVGVQMACAYLGSTFMPPLFGLIATKISISLYPFYLFVFLILMIVCNEIVNKIQKSK